MTPHSLSCPFLVSNMKKKLLLELQPRAVDFFTLPVTKEKKPFLTELTCCFSHPTDCSSVSSQMSLFLHT